MDLKTFRTMVVFAASLFSGTALLAFFAAPYAGSAYLMMIRGVGNQLPNLTLKIALPLLRVGPENTCDIPVTRFWVGVVWLVLILAPLGAAGWVWRGDTREDATARWLTSMSIYLPACCSLFIIVIAGLVVSLACM